MGKYYSRICETTCLADGFVMSITQQLVAQKGWL